MWTKVLYLSVACVLTGCQSSVPIEIRQPVLDAPSIAQVQQDPQSGKGKRVRWGGVIASVENRADDTWVEVVSKTLGDQGRPVSDDVALGRFFARVPGFLDPAVYAADREITVYGVVEEEVKRNIGEKPYRYPTVRSERLYLWPVYLAAPYGYYPDPYWYDPFYYPYRFWPHRYWRRHPFGFSPYW